MVQRLKLKALFVFALIHVGLALSFYALYSFYGTPETAKITKLLPYLTAGTLMMYAGFLTAALFVYLPAAPWIHRAQRLLDFKAWVKELPTIVAMLPILIPLIAGVIHLIRKYWVEMKTHFKKGTLDVRSFAKLTRKFAVDAESHVNHTKTNHRAKHHTVRNGNGHRNGKNTVVGARRHVKYAKSKRASTKRSARKAA